jgi:activator of HSP90 ATPase
VQQGKQAMKLLCSRRSFVTALAALPLAQDSLRSAAANPAPAKDAGLSHSAASIHQEVTLHASPARVFEVLTDSGKFDAVTRLSDAVTLVTAPDAKPTVIGREAGSPFNLFGGYVTGRNLEMLPGQRLVQAWRAGSWAAGEFSVAHFALAADPAGCRLVFDHRGFPSDQGASLAYGWRVHYWEPLAKFLARPA